MQDRVFTSESVTEGHPDKVCDQISDAILDEIIGQDANARVACETLTTTGLVLVAGEVTTDYFADIQKTVRNTLEQIGYTDPEYGLDYQDCSVLTSIHEQSPDIAQGVDSSEEKEQGAGDQGLMFGFACNETPELMPAPIMYAHQLGSHLTKLRKAGKARWLRPDAKSQVSVQYIDDKPVKITSVVISTQHAASASNKTIRDFINKHVIQKVLPKKMLARDTQILINPTGRFVVGGPQGDSGLTGRKIIVDTYGGMGRHGGGAFSGKDPSKVDRSAAYMGRYVAKNIVAAGLAKRCEIQFAYAIGYPDPVSVCVDTFGTGVVDNVKIAAATEKVFSYKPADIIRQLKLLRPIYSDTTNYGHFGKVDDLATITWEKTDKVAALKRAVK